MGLRSVLSIDVDDSAWQDYRKSFDQYRDVVKSLPEDFAKQWQLLKGTKQTFNELVASMVAGNLQAKQTAAAQREADRLTRTWADSWRGLAKSSKDFAGNIRDATVGLLKWIGPLGLIGGLLGSWGGLKGLESLGAGVAAQRRNVMGLGVNYGQASAFNLNFGRFVDTQSMMGNVSSSLYDATSPGYTALMAAGINQRYLSSHNAADVSAELLHRLPGLLGNTPDHLIGTKSHALGLDNILSSQDIIRYLHASPDERRKQEESYKRDSKGLDMTPENQRAWQDFTTQIQRAGAKIENVFVTGLTPLAKPLEKLSEEFNKAVEAFLKSDTLKGFIDTLAKGLGEFADYVGSPKFRKDIHDFVDGVEYAAKKVIGWAKWLGLLPDSGDNTTTGAQAAPGSVTTAPTGRRGFLSRIEGRNAEIEYRRGHPGSPVPEGGSWRGGSAPGLNGGLLRPGRGGGGNGTPEERAEHEKYIRDYAASIGVNPNVAMWVAMKEGFINKPGDFDRNGRPTSFGDFQLHYSGRGAVGDKYTAATGYHAGDKAHWKDADKFALDEAKRHGWGAWSSTHGKFGPYYGIDRNQRAVKVEHSAGSDTIVTTHQAVN